MKYGRIFDMLLNVGHSSVEALEIIRRARHNNYYAKDWIMKTEKYYDGLKRLRVDKVK